MPRLVYLTAALRDLDEIARDIALRTQSIDGTLAFIDKLTDYCEHLAALPGLLGRARCELGLAYRSVAFGNYVIFFRYVDGDVPRVTMEIIHVLHGARDTGAFFESNRRED